MNDDEVVSMIIYNYMKKYYESSISKYSYYCVITTYLDDISEIFTDYIGDILSDWSYISYERGMYDLVGFETKDDLVQFKLMIPSNISYIDISASEVFL